MLNVLITDDEKAARISIKYLAQFEKYGFTNVFEAENAKESKKILQENAIDLLMTDICMPEEDGTSLMRWVRLYSPETKIITISGYQNFDFVLQSMRNGAVDYILKPINQEHLQKVLDKVVRLIKEKDTSNLEGNTLQDLKVYIEKNYDTPLQLDQIARKFGFNASYLSRKFKQLYGIGIIEYVTSIRIDKAMYFLLNTSLKQFEIAVKVGYKDEKYFSRVFAKVVGTSPNQWKKMHENQITEKNKNTS